VVLIILGVVGFSAWKIHGNLDEQVPPDAGGRRQSGGGDRAVPVMAVRVEEKTMPIFLTGLGTVTAYNSVIIKSRVDGQLIAVNVREGQKVRKGQLLAQIDPEPYAATLAQAEGQLTKDKATANYASAEADRYTALFKAGVIAQNSQQLQVANAGQSAGAVETDKAAIRAANVNLAYTRITSPVDGVVGLRQVDPGNIIHAGDAAGLLLITQVQPISVIFTLPEDQLPQVQHALEKNAKLEVDAYDRSEAAKLATGKLLTLDNVVDITTGTAKAKAVFDNKDSGLFPNQFVNVRLIMQQREKALVIPASAVQTGTQGNFVYVMKKGDPPKAGEGESKSAGKGKGGAKSKQEGETADNSGAPEKADDKPKYYVELRSIVVDVTEGTQVIVGSGLAAGEQVVIDGLEKLKNSSKVQPQKDASKEGGKRSKGGEAKGDAGQPEAGPKPGDKGKAETGKGAEDGSAPHEHHHHGQQP
jgi:multidrug efflux system membrane fusion protein